MERKTPASRLSAIVLPFSSPCPPAVLTSHGGSHALRPLSEASLAQATKSVVVAGYCCAAARDRLQPASLLFLWLPPLGDGGGGSL